MGNAVSSPVGVGVLGLGRSGWGLHVQTLVTMAGRYEVRAVCDALPERREQAAAETGAETYKELDAMLDDPKVDLVVVSSPSHMHREHAVRALSAGKSVLVEKPFAISLEDAREMFDAARTAGRGLFASQNLRFEGTFLKIREVIASGAIGAIVEIRASWHWFRRRWDWQTLTELGGGSLNNDGTHVIDQVLSLVPQSLPDVWCRMRRTPLSAGDAEDHVKILLSGPDAPLIDLEFSNACGFPQDQWLIMGTKGSLTGGHGLLRWRYVDMALVDAISASKDPTVGRSYNNESLPWVEQTADLSSETYNQSVRRLYLALFDTLRHQQPNPVSEQSVMRQLQTIADCRRAARGIEEVAE